MLVSGWIVIEMVVPFFGEIFIVLHGLELMSSSSLRTRRALHIPYLRISMSVKWCGIESPSMDRPRTGRLR